MQGSVLTEPAPTATKPGFLAQAMDPPQGSSMCSKGFGPFPSPLPSRASGPSFPPAFTAPPADNHPAHQPGLHGPPSKEARLGYLPRPPEPRPFQDAEMSDDATTVTGPVPPSSESPTATTGRIVSQGQSCGKAAVGRVVWKLGLGQP